MQGFCRLPARRQRLRTSRSRHPVSAAATVLGDAEVMGLSTIREWDHYSRAKREPPRQGAVLLDCGPFGGSAKTTWRDVRSRRAKCGAQVRRRAPSAADGSAATGAPGGAPGGQARAGRGASGRRVQNPPLPPGSRETSPEPEAGRALVGTKAGRTVSSVESVTVWAGERLRSTQACPAHGRRRPEVEGLVVTGAEGRVLSLELQRRHRSHETWARGSRLHPTTAQRPGCRTRRSGATEERWLQAAGRR